MPLRHTLLAVLVAALWGLNFLAIHASLEHFPPLFLVALRFAVLAVPTLLLVPRPQVPVRWLVGYGLGFGTLQFVGLYLGMAAGFPAGLASLVLQASAPFTVLLGVLLLGERLTPRRAVGVGVAVLGLVVVGASRADGSAGQLLPFLLVVLGAFGWAIGNLSSRLAAPPNPLHLTLWMSVVPPLPMLAVSLLVEGPGEIGAALATSGTTAALPAWLGLAYTVVLGTVVGSGIWVWLLARHPAGVVAPFSMLVPVVGISAAWWALGERPTVLELSGGALVVGGVLWAARRGRPAAAGLAPVGLDPVGLDGDEVPVTAAGAPRP
ncbi:EamA family transporter [uncultured Serinicoccus sp.]|uniref:EamA family transporter n=1 Tax=uncultured Serinicoccus sp. TaxID=735514 RepID=UPI00261F3AD3|nr:EamA family transporter [uncultured Serinicoccus sp.]